MVVKIHNLSISIEGNEILKDVGFHVKEGELIGLLGPNGAGKSSTLKVLAGLIPDYNGSVLIFGKEFKNHREGIKERLGYVPEELQLYNSLSPYDFLQLVGALYGLSSPFLHNQMEYYFSYFDIASYRNKKIASLSKGTKQKLLLTASLMHDPDMLLLDEPLDGLDIVSVVKFRELLRQLKSNKKSILFSTHTTSFLEKIADSIVIMYQGQIKATMSMPDILANYKDVESFYLSIINPGSVQK